MAQRMLNPRGRDADSPDKMTTNSREPDQRTAPEPIDLGKFNSRPAIGAR